MIDVIIPVYDGLEETKRCIQSVLNNKNTMAFNVLVIEDCSPNAEIQQYLHQLSGEGKIELHVNKVNKGFVGTVNFGMSLHADRDVVLLNSDTEVANDLLDRICAHADKDKRATVQIPHLPQRPFSQQTMSWVGNNEESYKFPHYLKTE
jgi:GT2 family glycosyltransferase